MSFSIWLNRALSTFNISISKRSTLVRQAHELAELRLAKESSVPTNGKATVLNGNQAIPTLRQIQEEIAGLRQEILKNQVAMQWRISDLSHNADLELAAITCELCGYEGDHKTFKVYKSHCIFGGGKLLRHQCPQCDAIFGPKKMLDLNAEELTQEYEIHYRLYQEGDSTAQEIRAFHALNPTREGQYLNYGAGAWSRSVSELRRDGWNVFAYEPHESASSSDFLISNPSRLATMKFDGIFSNNVLEHFRHPVEELRNIAAFLKPLGKMSHATPCFEYLYEYTRFHLFFFPGRSRILLADKADLTIDDFVVDGEFMNLLLSKK